MALTEENKKMWLEEAKLLRLEFLKKYKNALHSALSAPNSISLHDQGILNLPEGYFFIPTNEAAILERALGSEPDSELLGIIASPDNQLPWDEEFPWYISIGHTRDGFVRNDLHTGIKGRVARYLLEKMVQEDASLGKAPIHKNSLHLNKPELIALNYDNSAHQLICLAAVLESGWGEDYDVNYNIHVFGREGFIHLTLVTKNTAIQDDKIHAQKILDALKYNYGKRYEDYVEGKDKIDAYGLADQICYFAYSNGELGIKSITKVLLKAKWILLVNMIIVTFSYKIRDSFKP